MKGRRTAELCRGGRNLLASDSIFMPFMMDRWTGGQVDNVMELKSWPENKPPILHGTVERKSASLPFINTVTICDYMTDSEASWLSVTIKLRNF